MEGWPVNAPTRACGVAWRFLPRLVVPSLLLYLPRRAVDVGGHPLGAEEILEVFDVYTFLDQTALSVVVSHMDSYWAAGRNMYFYSRDLITIITEHTYLNHFGVKVSQNVNILNSLL